MLSYTPPPHFLLSRSSFSLRRQSNLQYSLIKHCDTTKRMQLRMPVNEYSGQMYRRPYRERHAITP